MWAGSTSGLLHQEKERIAPNHPFVYSVTSHATWISLLTTLGSCDQLSIGNAEQIAFKESGILKWLWEIPEFLNHVYIVYILCVTIWQTRVEAKSISSKWQIALGKFDIFESILHAGSLQYTGYNTIIYPHLRSTCFDHFNAKSSTYSNWSLTSTDEMTPFSTHKNWSNKVLCVFPLRLRVLKTSQSQKVCQLGELSGICCQPWHFQKGAPKQKTQQLHNPQWQALNCTANHLWNVRDNLAFKQWTARLIDRLMDGWMDGWMNGWMDGWMDWWIDWLIDWLIGSFIYGLIHSSRLRKNTYKSVHSLRQWPAG